MNILFRIFEMIAFMREKGKFQAKIAIFGSNILKYYMF